MKKSGKLLLGILFTFVIALAVSCGRNDDSISSSDGSGSPGTSQSEAATASYKVEYYLENDEGGYTLDESMSGFLTGEVGQTVNIERKTIDGYVLETEYAGNVLRGKVLADGTLVLKAYYSKDYTGRVTFETELGEEIDLLKGQDTQLAVKVKVDGVEVEEGITYSSSYKTVVVDENGLMTAKMRGTADIAVSYKNVSKTFHATVYDAFIDSEEDWWAVYDHLSYWYKFTADVVLSESTVEHFTVKDEQGNETTPGYLINKDFTGVIDGGGYSLTYQNARLFHWISGTDASIRNITLNASDGFYWGAAISYGLEGGAVIDNVTLNASYKDGEMQRAISSDFWIKLGGDQGVNGLGGMFGMIGNVTVQNCTLDLIRLPDTAHFGAIAYQVAENAVIKNCKVTSTDGSIELFRFDKDNTTKVTDSSVTGLESAEYKVAYYLESDDGFAEDESLRETLTGFVGKTATVTAKSLSGYAFDADNVENVLSGEVKKDGSLTLKLYYKRSNITFETQTAEKNELEKSGTLDLAVTVKEDGEEVVDGVTYTSSDDAVATVADGVVTAHKGGTATITVSFARASRTFEITVWDKFISAEEDWWSMLTGESIEVSGYYKLTADLTLTDSVAAHFGKESYKINHTFAGVLDGGGYTLTYTGAKLFTSLTGTLKNITLNAGKDHYWGSAVAYFVANATITDVTVTAEFSRENTYWYSNGFIAAPGAGVFGIWIDGTTFENCTVNVTLSGAATADYYCGIGYEVKNSTIKNVTVNTRSELVLYKTGDSATNNVINSEVKIEDPYVLISTEEEFWKIYESETTLAGCYKLANDLTLTKNSCEDGKHEINYNFTGVLNGDGHTLTYTGSRLFHTVDGTIENITLNAGKGYYWGSAIAFTINKGAVLRNVTVNAEFESNETRQAVGDAWITAPGMGGLCVWLAGTVENCTINLTLSGSATSDYCVGIAYDVSNSTLTNVTVNSATELQLYKSGTASSETDVNFVKTEAAD